jgi:exonuclease SbcD
VRFLHTSDWHLGRGLGGHDLSAAQAVAVDAIIDVAIDRKVQAFVIAGDVFDRAFPSVEDVRALNRAFTRIHGAGIRLIATAGNHDEGARLAAFKNLLDDAVCIVGEYEQVGTAVELLDEHGLVVFYPLPYLDPDGARRALAPAPDELLERKHEAVMAEAMRRVREDLTRRRAVASGVRAVVVAHAFVVTGKETLQEVEAERSDSERDLAVGGLPTVPSAVFDGVDYVALGHLHGPRQVGKGRSPHIRYSGSILRYSVSEVGHEKSCSIVDIDASGACTVETVAVPQPAGMARLRGTLAELCSDLHSSHANDYVELVLTDTRLPDNYYAQLTERFTRILNVSRERSTQAADGHRVTQTDGSIPAVTPMDTLQNFYQNSTGEEPDTAVVAILQDILERAQKSVEA